MHSKRILLFCLVLMATFVAGCAGTTTNVEIGWTRDGGASVRISISGEIGDGEEEDDEEDDDKDENDAKSFGSSSLLSNSDGYGYLVLDTRNVSITNDTGTISVILKNESGSTIASRDFSYYLSGSYVYAADPRAVDEWIARNSNNLGNISFEINDISYVETGSNVHGEITAEAWYNSTKIGAATATRYIDNDGGAGSGPIRIK